jgi:hypothetical protein
MGLGKTPPVKLARTTISSPRLKTGIKVDPKLLALRSRWTLAEQENLLQPKVTYKPQSILAIK